MIYTLEDLDGDEWVPSFTGHTGQPVTALFESDEPHDPDHLATKWLTDDDVPPGIYRVAVYDGAELVGSSAEREIT